MEEDDRKESAAAKCAGAVLEPEGLLENAELAIGESLKSAARNVIAVGYWLKQIRDGRLYETAGYGSIWEYARERFGFSMSTASRYMARNDRFSAGGNSPQLDERYQEYGKSQLQEMLSLDEEQLERVSPEMTVKEIRQLRGEREEIPEMAIPGQMEITDFLDNPEQDGQEAEDLTYSQAEPFSVCLEELTEESRENGEAVFATSQQDPEEYSNPDEDGRPENPESSADIGEEKLTGDAEKEDMEEADEKPAEILAGGAEVLRSMIEIEQEMLKELEEEFADTPTGEIPMILIKQRLLVEALRLLLRERERKPDKSGEQEGENPEGRRQDMEGASGQEALPRLRNNGERKGWLKRYQDWGLWYEDQHIGARYYRYQFENGAVLIAEEYRENIGSVRYAGEWTSVYYHLVGGPRTAGTKWAYHETYSRYPDSETELVEFLKELQKNG